MHEEGEEWHIGNSVMIDKDESVNFEDYKNENVAEQWNNLNYTKQNSANITKAIDDSMFGTFRAHSLLDKQTTIKERDMSRLDMEK